MKDNEAKSRKKPRRHADDDDDDDDDELDDEIDEPEPFIAPVELEPTRTTPVRSTRSRSAQQTQQTPPKYDATPERVDSYERNERNERNEKYSNKQSPVPYALSLPPAPSPVPESPSFRRNLRVDVGAGNSQLAQLALQAQQIQHAQQFQQQLAQQQQAYQQVLQAQPIAQATAQLPFQPPSFADRSLTGLKPASEPLPAPLQQLQQLQPLQAKANAPLKNDGPLPSPRDIYPELTGLSPREPMFGGAFFNPLSHDFLGTMSQPTFSQPPFWQSAPEFTDKREFDFDEKSKSRQKPN